MLRVVTPRTLALLLAVLLATVLVGCRTAPGNGDADPDPDPDPTSISGVAGTTGADGIADLEDGLTQVRVRDAETGEPIDDVFVEWMSDADGSGALFVFDPSGRYAAQVLPAEAVADGASVGKQATMLDALMPYVDRGSGELISRVGESDGEIIQWWLDRFFVCTSMTIEDAMVTWDDVLKRLVLEQSADVTVTAILGAAGVLIPNPVTYTLYAMTGIGLVQDLAANRTLKSYLDAGYLPTDTVRLCEIDATSNAWRRADADLFALKLISMWPEGEPGSSVPKTSDLVGTVSNTATGQPLPQVAITLAGPEPRRATTDADGRFRIAGIPASDGYRVTASALGFRTTERDVVVPAASSVPVDLSIEPVTGYQDEISGTWRGTWTEAVWNFSSSFEAAFYRAGSHVDGSVTISGSPCFETATVAGTIQGDGVSVGSATASSRIDFNIVFVGDALSGSFRVVGGDCDGSFGQVSAKRVTP